jgi:hypothetical protein
MGQIAVNVNGNTTVPSVSSDEWNLFLNALEQSQKTMADTDYDWEGLRYVHKTTCGQSGTSVSLPANFVKPMGYARIEGDEFPEVPYHRQKLYASSDDYVTYYPSDKYMEIHPALTSVSAVDIPCLIQPSTLATATDRSFAPDSYLVPKASSIILLSRGDGKYAEYRDEADQALARAIGKEVNTFVQRGNTIPNVQRDKYDFTVGVD